MTNSHNIDQRTNKNFVVNNKVFLRQYALDNYEKFGEGIVVINLLLLKTDVLTQNKPFDSKEVDELEEITLHQPVAYIPEKNFWFKMLSLKIKKKYQIDIKTKYCLNKQFLIVFIKDSSIEHFSIYSLKLESS